MELMTKLKQKKRKADHVEFLRLTITDLHNSIVSEVIKGNSPINQAKLLKKYNRRLKLILY